MYLKRYRADDVDLRSKGNAEGAKKRKGRRVFLVNPPVAGQGPGRSGLRHQTSVEMGCCYGRSVVQRVHAQVVPKYSLRSLRTFASSAFRSTLSGGFRRRPARFTPRPPWLLHRSVKVSLRPRLLPPAT